MSTRFILVAGGVISGVGKGVISASLGKIMKEHGYHTTIVKIDPYINYDAGTLRPTEHGEVWVTHDGGEIDQDLGTYERFLDQDLGKKNNITTGQVYASVIEKERRGLYLGQTVQFVPHIVDEIKDRILKAAQGYEIAIVELGGTVGDYENAPYLFAIKALERTLGADYVTTVLVTYLPVPHHIQEMKTKPTQQAIRLLGQEGIHADFIICRSNEIIDDVRKKKIADCTHLPLSRIISAPDLSTIYQMPLHLEQEQLGSKILDKLGLVSRITPDWSVWARLVDTIECPRNKVKIAIIGKYLQVGDYSLIDSYISIYQALIHAGVANDTKIDIEWINAQSYEMDRSLLSKLHDFDGIIVPGGFGASGVEGKIAAIEYARNNSIPFLGLCYGMQLAVVEAARNLCGMQGAHTTEVDSFTQYPVIDLLPDQREMLDTQRLGATMRLGAYTAQVIRTSLVGQLYSECRRIQEGGLVSERHRHRYEVNPEYVKAIETKGILFSGKHIRDDTTSLMEFLEIPEHRFFVATQAHPEFTSRLGNPNPLFFGFVRSALIFQKDKHVAMHRAAMIRTRQHVPTL